MILIDSVQIPLAYPLAIKMRELVIVKTINTKWQRAQRTIATV